jgi:hypothetical protein
MDDESGDTIFVVVENGLVIDVQTFLGNNNYSSLTEGLIAYWKLDDSSGNAVDSTENGLDLTNNGAVQGELGLIGNSYSFDGVNSYLNIADSSLLNPTDGISIAAWVYKNSTDDMVIVDKSEDLAQSYMLRDYGQQLQWNINRGGTGSGETLIANTLPTGQWSFVVATYNRVSMKLYVDGELVGTTLFSEAITPSEFNLDLGTEILFNANNNQPFAPWNGLIDEFGMWNRPLSALEVHQLYNNSMGETYPLD